MGRRIRWATAGRAAAIVAAVLAGLASLPALLGGDEPPPLPEDVGLAQVSPPPPSPVVPPAPLPPVQAKLPGAAKRAKAARAARKAAAARRAERRRRERDEAGSEDADDGSGVTYVPTYAPAPPEPSRPLEFRFER